MTTLLKHLVFTWLLTALINVSPAFASEPPASPQQFATFDACRLASGETLEPCRVGYRTYGALNSDQSNAVLVPTWFGGTSTEHAFLATADIINPDEYFVVIVDALANGVSISPSNSSTQPDEQFPTIHMSDMVDSQYRLLTEVLGIESLHAIVGVSMGGMQAFEWSVRYPDFAKKTVAAIATPRLPPFDIALWTTNQRLLALYRQCECTEALEARAALWMLSNVPSQFALDTPREKTVSTIVDNAAANPISISESWDIQRQLEAMISHNIARDYDDDMKRAAAQFHTELLIIVSTDDRVVTPEPARRLATSLGTAFVELDEDCGHADPWCAPDQFAEAVRTFVNSE